MKHCEIRDRDRIEAFLRRDPGSHIYALADLDDFFWPRTFWYGAVEGEELQAVCLLLDGLIQPILYAVCPDGDAATRTSAVRLYESLGFRSVRLYLEGVFSRRR